MLKKTIKFNDVDGNTLEEDFYFNLTKAEALEIQFSHHGGLEEHVKQIVAAKQVDKLIELFKEILVKTVGRRSDDGRRFIKSKEITDDFLQTEAYSELFLQLATDSEFAIQFMKGIMPADIQQEIEKQGLDKPQSEQPAITEAPSSSEPAWITEGRAPTVIELQGATPEQIQLAFQRKQASQEQKADLPVVGHGLA